MVFCGADFQVSKAPVASVAIQIKAKLTVNDAAKKTSKIRDFATELKQRLELAMGAGWHIVVGGDYAVDLRYVRGWAVKICKNMVVNYEAVYDHYLIIRSVRGLAYC